MLWTDTLAVGTGERLRVWRIHSCPAGYRNRCGVDQDHSGAEASVKRFTVLICPGHTLLTSQSYDCTSNTGGVK